MPLILLALIVVAVGSVATAAWVYSAEQARRQLVHRAAAPASLAAGDYRVVISEKAGESLTERLLRRMPQRWSINAKTSELLLHAGYGNATAPVAYASIRVGITALLVMLAIGFAPKTHFRMYLLYVIIAAAGGWMLPMWYVTRAARTRQDRVRRSLPDCLDLLVVCIEAGISLDAALLRVAKDMSSPHPILARELLIINQKTNAGMTRQDALKGLWERTGVGEVRALVSHIVQGEKWGTSTGKVLRVYAETLRRERKQAAEKKAATAPVKMLVPLGVFIFPAILLVVMGPVVVAVSKMFGQH